MTNRTDLDKCSAQIELVKQLLGPETFDLKKILIELETKKKLLMTFKPRSYAKILKGLESGVLKHPGAWVEEEKKVENPKETKRILGARQAKADEIQLAKEPSKEEKVEIDKTGMSIQEDGLLHQDPIPNPEVDPKEAEIQRLKDQVAELEKAEKVE